MEHIGAHIDREKKRGKQTERGELLRFFCEKLNRTRPHDGLPMITLPRMGRLVEKIPTKDLYYLKSICDDSASRGGIVAFSKRFWWEINPKKHEPKKEPARRQAGGESFLTKPKYKKTFGSATRAPRPPRPKPLAKRVSKRDLHNLY